MRMHSLVALLGLAFALSPAPARCQTATLTVLSSNGTKAVVEALGPMFEKATGHTLVFRFANSADLTARVTKGEAFDIAILTAPRVSELVEQGKLAAATRTNVARAGAGMVIHPLATKPDISTADALKGALVRAKSIAYVGQGATAAIVRPIFEQFGITEAMNAKTTLVLSAAHAVAAGEAEIGFTQISEILNVPGAVLAGPLPPELQVYTVFQAAVSANSAAAAAARNFLAFLTSPAAAAIIKEKGMESIDGDAAAISQDRMPPIASALMTPAQRQAEADFTSARGRDMTGPFHALLRSPELMTRTRAMGDYLRYKSALPPRLSEFVILITAREWTQAYEWNVHHPIALKAGVDPQVARAIAEGRRPADMAEDEAILYDFCQELHRNKKVGDATYARALAKFGERGVMDAIGITGYYTMLAMVLNTAQTPAGPPASPALGTLPR